MADRPDSEPESRDPFEVVAEEYLERRRRGEDPSIEEYAARFPEIAGEIRDLLPTLEFMEGAAATPPDETASDTPTVPREFGGYTIVRELGRGGQGCVYLARDSKLGRNVALKVLSTAPGAISEDRLQRFRREAEVASKVDHPGICTVYETGRIDGTPYIAMRYVEGEPLSHLLARAREASSGAGRLDVFRTVRLIEDTARALHAAHERGLVHRDIKPANIMVTGDGTPVILDFGLARDELAEGETLTLTGDLLGTPAYMSPEQIDAKRAPLDRRTDVYSLGVTLYECLTLRRPFEAPTRERLYRQILETDPSDPGRTDSRIPRDLGIVVATALEKDRERRYLTAHDFAEDLRRVREFEPIRARPAGPLLRLRRTAQRHPGVAASLAGIFLVISAALAVALTLLAQKNRALRHTRAVGLATAAEETIDADPMLSLLLAREAVAVERIPETISALHHAVASVHVPVVLAGHTGQVMVGRFSPDGERVLTAALDGTARLWSLDGKLLRVLEHDAGNASVLSAAFSPSGARILTTGTDGTARLWDAEGEPVAVFEHEQGVWCGAMSPDGRFIATGTGNNAPSSADQEVFVHIWDASGAERQVLPAGRGYVSAVSFSIHGNWLLAGSLDGNARLWRFTESQTIGDPILLAHDGPITTATFSHDGTRIVMASGLGVWAPSGLTNTASVWDTDGRKLATFGGPLDPVTDAVFSDDGQDVLVTYRDESVRRFTPEGLRKETYLPRLAVTLVGAWTSSDGDRVLAVTRGGIASLFERGGRELTVLRGHVGSIWSGAFSPDGRRIVTTSADGTARVWETRLRQPPLLRGHTGPVVCANFSPDGAKIATCSIDRTACIWDAETGEYLRSFEGHTNFVNWVEFSPDGQSIATASEDRTARLWNLDGPGFRTIGGSEGHTGPVTSVDFSPDGRRLVTASKDTTAILWDIEAQRPEKLATLRGHGDMLFSAVFSPEGDRILTSSLDGTAKLWSLTGEEILTFEGHTGYVWGASFSSDGAQVLTASADGTARLWDAETGEFLAETPIKEGEVTSAFFSPDDDFIVTANRGGIPRLWTRDFREICALRGHEGATPCATFSPDGRRIVTASKDGTARVWLVNVDELLNLARKKSIRGYTDTERRRYSGLLEGL